MNSKSKTSIVVVLIVLAAVGAWLFHANESSQPTVQTAIRTSQSRDVKNEITVAPKARQPSVPRPVSASPNTYEEYQQRKRCLNQPADTDTLLREIAEMRASISSVAPEYRKTIEQSIQQKQDQLNDINGCRSAGTPPTRDELSRALERLARSGDRAAQLEYAKNPGIDPFRTVENLDRLRAWRDSAISYVTAGVRDGNPDAMIALAGAYDPFRCEASGEPACSGMLNNIVPADAFSAYQNYYAAQLTGQAPSWVATEMSALERLLTPEQIAEARREAQAQRRGQT